MGLLGELAKEGAEAVTKRGARKSFKTLKEIPEEVKTMPTETRVNKAAEILDNEPVKEFGQVRQQDIAKDTRATYAEYSKVDNKIGDIESQPMPEIPNAANEDTAKLESLYERKRDLYLKAYNLKKEKELTGVLNSYIDEGKSAKEGIFDILSDKSGQGRAFSNVEAREKAIYNRVNTKLYELKENLRTKNLGLSQNMEMMDEVVRYLKDGKVKNQKLSSEVKKIADQWTEAAETIKKLRNRAGGRIGKLEDWVMPQSHNSRKIKKAGYKAWRKNIIGKLDTERIEAQFNKPIEDILESAYKNITTPHIDAGTMNRNGAVLAKRGEESRVLHFKDGDSLLSYNKEFGNADIFGTMDAHLRQQSKEIAMMQIMGANPENTFNKLKELARADGMGSLAEGDLDRLWKVTSGQVDGDSIVNNADATFAAISGGYRSLQIASKLGSATVSSLADLSNIVMGAGYRGLSSVKIAGRAISTLLQEATTIGKVGKNIELANRIGVVSEFANASLANSRFAESVGSGFLQRASEGVIRASGLGSWTTSMRASFGLELAANIAENFGKKLDDVGFANMLKEYGVTASEWDIIRKTKARDIKGSKFLDMDEVYKANEDLGYKLSEMITNEMNSFVIEPSDRVRRFTTMGAKKGTLKGEAARTVLLFKTFPISYTMMHLGRMAKIEGTLGKSAYAAKLIAVNTVMGGITLWAYDTVTGKSVRSIDRPAFVMESLAKSGGLGIFGDFFIGMAETKYGSSFSDILLGVPASTVSDIVKTAQDFGTKDFDKAVGNTFQRAKGYIPGQNLWYTRAVIERTIGDTMSEMIDPDYHKKLRRRDKALRLRDQKMLFK